MDYEEEKIKDCYEPDDIVPNQSNSKIEQTLPDDYEPNTMRKTEHDENLGPSAQLLIGTPRRPNRLDGPGV